jgi:hypothetical protein
VMRQGKQARAAPAAEDNGQYVQHDGHSSGREKPEGVGDAMRAMLHRIYPSESVACDTFGVFAKEYVMDILTRTSRGRTAVLTVTKREEGWEVRHTQDATVVRRQTFSDWHRVERAMMRFEQTDGGDATRRSGTPAPRLSQSEVPPS